MSIKAVIFDMDGLLVDSEPIYQTAWKAGVAEFGHTLTEEVNLGMLGLNDVDSEAVLIREFGEDFPLPAFRERWPAIWDAVAEEKGLPQKPGAAALLDALSERQVPMAIATSSPRNKMLRCLPMAGIHNEFQAQVCGPEVAHGKPAPDIYLAAADAIGFEPQQCIALEDSNNGMRAALDAGMQAIMVPDLKGPDADVAERATYIVNDLMAAHEIIFNVLA